ncbi:unnamed protein product [Didymodactylos carnosus]|uniref:Acyl-CoA synthetase short-chain family member 3, mitochondrial n=1 Tax=Didymodactylos carnosus TaxID=1234261 RepID=A0A814KRH8_9BILA|nr:unnamed protein product [Didymodactylos carnosus]CAF1054369.1 unnamed protein product [Didymodactylos carnosus]CAF3749910.1 unnamed protein product [Didymodactylos carnosus]CAF3823637.1 unnamed protein product [Didymodactylos carnosus]
MNKSPQIRVRTCNFINRRYFSSVTPKLNPNYNQIFRSSIDSPEEFWSNEASSICWFGKWSNVLNKKDLVHPKWFDGGRLNMTYNCVDRHCLDGRGSRIAIIHDSAMTGQISRLTYSQLLDKIKLLSGVMTKYGIKKGDVVLIYMPMIPEAVVTMLSCARLGVIHNLVFGGFSAKELATRIRHSEPKLIISANVGYEPQRVINYKEILDEAIELSGVNQQNLKCFIYNRTSGGEKKATMKRDRDRDFTDEISSTKPYEHCETVESNHPLYLLYTSGTTGKPKAIVRPTGGYAVALQWTMKYLYAIKPDDVWWSAADLGWVVGHSYTCYGPLLNGSTSVLYEGKPVNTPDASSFFRVIDQHDVVSSFVSPTAIRVIRQYDDAENGIYSKKYPMRSLRSIFVAGEHCDKETITWARKVFNNKPIVDHWWQTETGTAVTATCLGIEGNENDLSPPGCTGRPCPGYDVKLIQTTETDDHQEEKTNEIKFCEPEELGQILIKLPLPPGNFTTLWKDHDLYKKLYFEKYPGYYNTMDVGYLTRDGYLEISARMDDVINVAGHRLSSGSIEQAILDSRYATECAVVGLKDQTKGHVPFAFVISKISSSDNKQNIIDSVRKQIGPVAAFRQLVFVKRLPKTRSGKIARNTLAALINNKKFNIPSTIEDETVYNELIQDLQQAGYKELGTPLN